ncbi:MAG: AmmeMemoRadiSam system protein A [Nanoarchaeota archaeon]|nr:AmmeMemoRadiSam system protein A [Nanoarchaeota archaeon]MBU4086180.1 AmmeMemoRadiSam system protein A [Nanoarchaeota archaeon]
MVGEYSEDDGKKLLQLARESIEERFSGREPEKLEGKQFKQARGVFVTLTENGELRGCIGLPYPSKSIFEAVAEAAKSAGFSDPRFPKLTQEELKRVKIEISILTMPQETSVKDIKTGRDGLICSYMGYSGLLLPQVALEYNWSKLQFLENLCRKAGLPKDAWQKSGFKLMSFQAEIFCEK